MRPEMEITMRWHRLLRALAFLLGGLVFSVAIVFIFSNLAPIEVHWRIPATIGYAYDLTLPGVNTWIIALVPLLIGLAVGYLYQTPARMHHVREALRHRHRVHELEHELKEMRTSLDRLLMMPEDGRPAIPAQIMAAIEDDPARDPRLPDEPEEVEVLAAKPVLEDVKPEVAEIKLPASIPTTVVARPRRDARAANGKAKSTLKPATKPAARAPKAVKKRD